MPFPKTEDEAERQGYRFDNASRCRGCHESIEWWETPNGKKMPMNLDFTVHWSTCPEAERFRQEKHESD
jgi:hypothetical protein